MPRIAAQHETRIIHDADIAVDVSPKAKHTLHPYLAVPQSWYEMGWMQVMSGGQMKTALVLCKHGNDEGRCFPGIPTLMRVSGCSHGTVCASLNWLEAVGLISRYTRRGKGNEYQIHQATRHAAKSSPVRGNGLPPVQPTGRPPVQLGPVDPSSPPDANYCSSELQRTTSSASQEKELHPSIARFRELPEGIQADLLERLRVRYTASPEVTAKLDAVKDGLIQITPTLASTLLALRTGGN